MKKLGFCLAALALLAGCATVRETAVFNGVKVEDGREPLATLEVENSGWFLLGFIPIACGNPAKPNVNACLFCQNTVTLENNLSILHNEAKKLNAGGIINMTSHWTDESAFVILFKHRVCHTSAVLLKPAERVP